MDMNGFYAGVECLENPALRNKPVIVVGDPQARHGIVLAKSQLAKDAGIKTGEAIWQAQQKCPGVIAVKARHHLYGLYSTAFRRILADYTDLIEPFGLDEAWLDISASGMTWFKAQQISIEIMHRVYKELGLTISIGLSFNKPFAKLGSDYEKPCGFTVITPSNYQQIVWPMPVQELLFVGEKTRAKLAAKRIVTIGDLARVNPKSIKSWLGKNGLMLRTFARGEDWSPVMHTDDQPAALSIGNSTTTPVDMVDLEDYKCVLTLLLESVCARMNEQWVRGRTVNIFVRRSDLSGAGCQRTIRFATANTRDIREVALSLFHEKGYQHQYPFRSIGVTMSGLESRDVPTQIDLFGDEVRRMKRERAEETVYRLKRRFGQKSVELAICAFNKRLRTINPKEDDKYKPPAPQYFIGNEGVMNSAATGAGT